jgi:PhnB protein
MAPDVQLVPDDYPTLTASILVRHAAEAIDYYRRAFGAEERLRLDGPDGTIAHAELGIGDSVLMLADEMPGALSNTPQALGGVTTTFSIYVPDVDAAFERAIQAGGTVERPVQDQFYGDRTGTLRDPFGHYWSLMTHVEDVSLEEMQRRLQEMSAQQ